MQHSFYGFAHIDKKVVTNLEIRELLTKYPFLQKAANGQKMFSSRKQNI